MNDLIEILNTIREQGYHDDEIRAALRAIYPNGYSTASQVAPFFKNQSLSLEEMVTSYPLWFKVVLPYLWEKMLILRCQSHVNRLLKEERSETSIKLAIALVSKEIAEEIFLENDQRSMDAIIFAHPYKFSIAIDKIS